MGRFLLKLYGEREDGSGGWEAFLRRDGSTTELPQEATRFRSHAEAEVAFWANRNELWRSAIILDVSSPLERLADAVEEV